MCIRTYGLGEPVREVSSSSLPVFGDYTILCSETFGVRVADGGSREDLPFSKVRRESSGEWLDAFSQEAEIIRTWPEWKRDWAKAHLKWMNEP